MKLFFGLLALLPLLANANSCKLKLFSADEENWRSASFGLIQGLYKNPPADCTLCKSFSTDMVYMNRGYVAL